MPVLTINGEQKEFAEDSFPRTGAQLIALLGLNAEAVVAEVDGTIIARAAFAAYPLHDGQRLELVRFVGGG